MTRTHRKSLEERIKEHSRDFYLGTGLTKAVYALCRAILSLETEPERLAREKKAPTSQRRPLPKKLDTGRFSSLVVKFVEEEARGPLDSKGAKVFGAGSVFSLAARRIRDLLEEEERMEEADEEDADGEEEADKKRAGVLNWQTGLGFHIKTIYCREKGISLDSGGAHRTTASVDFELEICPAEVGNLKLKFKENVPRWPSPATVEKEAEEKTVGDRDASRPATSMPVDDLLKLQSIPKKLADLECVTVFFHHHQQQQQQQQQQFPGTKVSFAS
jgi:hypothetical protein